MNICPYCDEPLDHGTGEVRNGLHQECQRKLTAEMDEAFLEFEIREGEPIDVPTKWKLFPVKTH